jgi:siderophore synthetase component
MRVTTAKASASGFYRENGEPATVQSRTDPVDDPDPARAADGVAAANLLRCWVRETALPRPADGVLRADLPATGVRVEAPLLHWSPVGWHRFGPARLVPLDEAGSGVRRGDRAEPVGAAALAALLVREAAARGRCPDGVAAEAEAELVARVTDSAAHTARFLAVRRTAPHDPAGTTPFLASEQALVLGHPLHPVPKSREGLSAVEAAAYSPELRGAFPLHWFAADPSVVSSDWAPGGTTAVAVVADLLGDDLAVPDGMIAIPAHPWQARDLPGRPGIASLIDAGLLRDLGPAGPPWSATSSLRTVYRADAPVMLKFSLGLTITNSRRENLRKELRRGAEVYRLLAAGLGAELTSVHPGFDIVRDPGWLAVDLPGAGTPDSGLDLVLRENRFGRHDLVRCLAGLVAERPGAAPSQLAVLVKGLAVRARRTVPDVAREWFDRYLEAVVAPILWLYATQGIALEAHQQNTLVVLNAGGWPVGGRYRDNQGYYFAESRAADLARRLPHAGEDGDSIVADEVVDERLGYYLGVNNVMGLIGAFGSQGLADERLLLGDFRRLLTRFAVGSRVPGVVPALLDGDTLRCKANLLTRINGLDELVEPLATQSVYVEIPNPLRDVAR